MLIHGINGAMGRKLVELLEDEEVFGFDHQTDHPTIHVFDKWTDVEAVDVIIDFSHYSMVDSLIDYALATKTPCVICTTGLSEETQSKIQTASRVIPVFQSGNMSLGINVLIELAKIGAQSLNGFDVEIIEKHHSKKVDAPSGTAFMLAEAIQSIQTEKSFIYGREGTAAKREEDTIGIHAVRGGTITGDHSIIFAGIDEVIELKHQATSKTVFAKGAVEAAYFLIDKEPSLYNMGDLIRGGI
jgi:4-hydroxy-tetrahydrodipicolinate reductase